jgi:GDP-L-fucose synthase
MIFNFTKNTKIYVAGHNGLLGSAFIRYFNENKYSNLLTKTRDELELTSTDDVNSFFKKNKPEIVILAAGKVGGIIKNRDFPADFMRENLSIQQNVFNASQEYGVKKIIFFGSSCMYPKETSQPMKENQLFTGQLEPTSVAYATAKYAGVQSCQAFNRQNSLVSFISVIPNSVYGPNDNFDLDSAHVLSALIRRFVEANNSNVDKVVLWGTGSPKREFIFSDDVANACIQLLSMNLDLEDLPINIGVGSDISIKDLAIKIAKIVGYLGKIEWDTSKPDGSSRKLLDSSKIKSLGWNHKMDLDSGLKYTYKWYLEHLK